MILEKTKIIEIDNEFHKISHILKSLQIEFRAHVKKVSWKDKTPTSIFFVFLEKITAISNQLGLLIEQHNELEISEAFHSVSLSYDLIIRLSLAKMQEFVENAFQNKSLNPDLQPNRKTTLPQNNQEEIHAISYMKNGHNQQILCNFASPTQPNKFDFNRKNLRDFEIRVEAKRVLEKIRNGENPQSAMQNIENPFLMIEISNQINSEINDDLLKNKIDLNKISDFQKTEDLSSLEIPFFYLQNIQNDIKAFSYNLSLTIQSIQSQNSQTNTVFQQSLIIESIEQKIKEMCVEMFKENTQTKNDMNLENKKREKSPILQKIKNEFFIENVFSKLFWKYKIEKLSTDSSTNLTSKKKYNQVFKITTNYRIFQKNKSEMLILSQRKENDNNDLLQKQEKSISAKDQSIFDYFQEKAASNDLIKFKKEIGGVLKIFVALSKLILKIKSKCQAQKAIGNQKQGKFISGLLFDIESSSIGPLFGNINFEKILDESRETGNDQNVDKFLGFIKNVYLVRNNLQVSNGIHLIFNPAKLSSIQTIQSPELKNEKKASISSKIQFSSPKFKSFNIYALTSKQNFKETFKFNVGDQMKSKAVEGSTKIPEMKTNTCFQIDFKKEKQRSSINSKTFSKFSLKKTKSIGLEISPNEIKSFSNIHESRNDFTYQNIGQLEGCSPKCSTEIPIHIKNDGFKVNFEINKNYELQYYNSCLYSEYDDTTKNQIQNQLNEKMLIEMVQVKQKESLRVNFVAQSLRKLTAKFEKGMGLAHLMNEIEQVMANARDLENLCIADQKQTNNIAKFNHFENFDLLRTSRGIVINHKSPLESFYKVKLQKHSKKSNVVLQYVPIRVSNEYFIKKMSPTSVKIVNSIQ